ncbi:hypothetical protein Csa_004003 [Cucumis sativus]|uniref:Uncharacterized protein n=1 Tax=Cucumis sativus TaxID=3659 RepID=A0A0A0KH66_CUCSA|nr:hypothetical protein Csa_004003 [Cucumis sativus]
MVQKWGCEASLDHHSGTTITSLKVKDDANKVPPHESSIHVIYGETESTCDDQVRNFNSRIHQLL